MRDGKVAFRIEPPAGQRDPLGYVHGHYRYDDAAQLWRWDPPKELA